MIKTLENFEPFNDVLYKSCFYNSLFPVIYHFRKGILPFLVNDVIVYTKAAYKDINLIKSEYVECSTIDEILESLGITYETKTISDNIIDDVVDALMYDAPVIIWADCFYESIRKDVYLKKHFSHTILIHGFDEEKKIFNIIEQKERETLSYRKCVIGYQDIIESYKGYVDNFFELSGEPTFHKFSICRSASNRKLNDINNEHSTSVYRNNLCKNKHLISDSLDNLNHFVKNYADICLVEEKLREYIDALVIGFTSIINSKQVEKYKLVNLNIGQTDILPLLSEIISKYKEIRAVLAKFMYSSVYKRHVFEDSIVTLKHIVHLEEEFYRALIQRLEK